MLAIPHLEELEKLQLEIPGLVDALQARSSSICEDVGAWLARVESRLSQCRVSAAGELAALRAKLISARRGVIPDGLRFQGSPSPRRVREATAAHVPGQACERLAFELRPHQERVREAHDILRALVASAGARGLLPGQKNGGEVKARSLGESWRAMANEPDLAPQTQRVQGVVGLSQALIVFARELEALVKNGNGRAGGA